MTTTEKIQLCAEALRRHHFETAIVENTQQAFERIKAVVEAEAPKIVSFGDSVTMRKTGIIDWLRENGDWKLLDGFDPSMPRPERLEIRRHLCGCQLLSSLQRSGFPDFLCPSLYRSLSEYMQVCFSLYRSAYSVLLLPRLP